MMIGMRALVFLVTILGVTADRAYNIDAMASNQQHAQRTAARLLDPPPTPQWWVNIAVLDSADISL